MQTSAKEIVKKLREKGFEAFFVGGCVRDLFLGQKPKDFDIATDAKPEQLEKIFEKSYPIGKKFGVILIEQGGHHFEVATFRSDSSYSDGRRPDAVMFSNPWEDAARRDFTINGIFYDPIKEEFHDFVDGIPDLRRGILRFIGDPETRIKEDFLRILRAVRFKNRFDLEYDAETKKALKKHASLVVGVSAERIREELSKMLMHPSRRKSLEDLKEFGILEKVLPEVAALETTPQSPQYHSEGNALIHTFQVMDHLEPGESLELYWASLLHDLGKAKTFFYKTKNRISFPNHQEVSAELTGKICRRLKFSGTSAKKIVWLVENHHLFDQWGDMKIATKFQYFENPFFDDLFKLHHADLMGSTPEKMETRERDLVRLERLQNDLQFARSEKMLPSHHEEFFTGEEIMKIAKIKAGKKVGQLKAKLRELQIEGKIRTKADAEKWIRKSGVR